MAGCVKESKVKKYLDIIDMYVLCAFYSLRAMPTRTNTHTAYTHTDSLNDKLNKSHWPKTEPDAEPVID